MNSPTAAQPQLDAIAEALVYATAYISIAVGDEDRQRDDCRTLESIADMLSRSTSVERLALVAAAERAIVAESAAFLNSPLVDAYRDFLETLNGLFPNDTNA